MRISKMAVITVLLVVMSLSACSLQINGKDVMKDGKIVKEEVTIEDVVENIPEDEFETASSKEVAKENNIKSNKNNSKSSISNFETESQTLTKELNVNDSERLVKDAFNKLSDGEYIIEITLKAQDTNNANYTMTTDTTALIDAVNNKVASIDYTETRLDSESTEVKSLLIASGNGNNWTLHKAAFDSADVKKAGIELNNAYEVTISSNFADNATFSDAIEIGDGQLEVIVTNNAKNHEGSDIVYTVDIDKNTGLIRFVSSEADTYELAYAIYYSGTEEFKSLKYSVRDYFSNHNKASLDDSWLLKK